MAIEHGVDSPTTRAPALRPVMERFPEYVQAVGMITIQLGDLETRLGDLLAVLLGIDTDVGHAIYFTPKSGVARRTFERSGTRQFTPPEN